ncbi:MAG: hypothetical protein R6V74_06545 [Lutibacter sp.]
MANSLFKNTAAPAGFISIADKSPPKAPKAPLIALYRAVPLIFSLENIAPKSLYPNVCAFKI